MPRVAGRGSGSGRMRGGSVALGVALTVGGCEAGPPTVGPPTLTPDETIPAVVHASWTVAAGASTWLEIGLDGELVRTTSAGAAPEAIVLGLKAGRTYAARAVAESEAGLRAWSEEVAWTTVGAPAQLPDLTVTEADPTAWAGEGPFLVPVLQAKATFVTFIDRAGDYVWWETIESGLIMPSVRITADRRHVLYEVNDVTYTHPDAGVHVVALDGSARSFTSAPLVHHDGIDLPDGRVAWLEHEEREIVDEDGTLQWYSGDVLMEAEPGGAAGTAQRVFSWLDDWGHSPWPGCTHMQETPYEGLSFDWTHTNSLGYDATSDNYFLLSHHNDALLRIDREGALLWQLGGRFGEFADEAGDQIDPEQPWKVDGPANTWWSHGHIGDFWEGGFVLFDNGPHHVRPVSRAVAYRYDEETRTVEQTFSFESENESFSPALGDVRRLPNGNWLIVWSLEGMLTEVTPDGRVVWRVRAELGSALLRSGFLDTVEMVTEGGG
ncbi:MAG: hypothetical protein EXR71_05145 [Myxococcales bacterium]|nr:hypothetical protein [Myxococcales bacterium]